MPRAPTSTTARTDPMERIRTALFDGGPIKTSCVAVAGWFSAASVKGFMEAVILTGTFFIVVIHAWNYAVHQWCHVRRRDWPDCSRCPFHYRVFCSRCTKDPEDT